MERRAVCLGSEDDWRIEGDLMELEEFMLYFLDISWRL